ncbi:D-alanine--D-alanine ligase family protein [Pilimelia columellifera]|uniref:D-alanine--D-alanine ligase n=1 Tax=Pilimelia columellifera subsp. columellifera TaxID=706583 RepID=A0ABP6ABW1_9ACTN
MIHPVDAAEWLPDGPPDPGVEDLRILVLAGGLSYEREVSLRSGRRALDALRAAGFDATMADVDTSLPTRLATDPPSAVLIALHGAAGEDGSIRAVLDLFGVPYLGPTAAAARVAWDKPTTKALLRQHGLPTPDWVALPHDRFSELGAAAVMDRIVGRLGLPLMVKPAQGGSGLGVSAVRDAGALPAAMVDCFAYGGTALIEQFVPGIDIAVSVIDLGGGPRALPVVEIVPHDGHYDYAARYTPGRTTWHAPARLSADLAERVAVVAVAAHGAVSLRDLSRVDLIVTPSGAVQVLDVNVSPGMTETSLLPLAVQAAGLDLGATLGSMVARVATRSS